jgi:hypothetical protein
MLTYCTVVPTVPCTYGTPVRLIREKTYVVKTYSTWYSTFDFLTFLDMKKMISKMEIKHNQSITYHNSFHYVISTKSKITQPAFRASSCPLPCNCHKWISLSIVSAFWQPLLPATTTPRKTSCIPRSSMKNHHITS